jgi:acetyl-CoA synthetase
MFRGYLNEEERYRKCFTGAWYLTGDLARRDADGYFWFIGRADDVIKSSGHLIGPFEVESALMEHPAVAEAGVIGIPGRSRRRDSSRPSCRSSLAISPDEAAAPRRSWAWPASAWGRPWHRARSSSVNKLPSTRSGKIMRRLLRAQELGLPEGDTSTLEGGSNE